ncbi:MULTISPECIES: efflux RND transporter periplasmic adaptor subunit [Aeromonas]|uniref:efflux RND transporter periplasmic adaptor subunit n=1 Tax=Aeromonas TaxID=642 RepID=UPI00069A4EE8|nr:MULTISPECIES: HlyD family efflux transporter periplasmic adaptor subunit [Aeromonas]QXC29208.1 HlyD family efflux transporter periplasmic adaptor subunit [Aeromonas sp. FDAARGOS 1409]
MKTTKLLSLLLCMVAMPLWAHGGEDHGEMPQTTVSADKPQRLPDGRVLLPKSAQHRLSIHTTIAVEGSYPKAFELSGHVVIDPNKGGWVQSAGAGKIQAPASGFPQLGAVVHKGQTLAIVHPAADSFESSRRQAELSDAQSALRLAEQDATRLADLTGSVPRKDIEAAVIQLKTARAKVVALNAGSAGEILRAPVDGVVATSNAMNGQMVEAGTLIFEIIAEDGMQIEALAYDASMVNDIASATLNGKPLRYLGGALSLRDGALPMRFKPEVTMPLALGQPVKIVTQNKAQMKGIKVPASSVVKNAANESIVWLHESALLFRAMPVRVSPLDGESVLVLGAPAQARVVTQGATLINQIR